MGWDESEDKFKMGTTTATGSSTGSLTITTGSLIANLEGTVGANNVTTGNFTTVGTTGDVSVGGNLTVGGHLVADANEDKNIFTEVTSETIQVGGDGQGGVHIPFTTDSSDGSTGALVIDGGVGIKKKLNVVGAVDFSSTLNVGGNLTVGGHLVADANEDKNIFTEVTSETIQVGGDGQGGVHIPFTTDSSDGSTGALVIDGGVGIKKNLNVEGDLDGTGDLTMGTITMPGFSVDDDGDTVTKSLDNTNGGIN